MFAYVCIYTQTHIYNIYIQLCTFGVVVDAGSRDEVPGEEDGVCHLFEAMAFRSTNNMSHQLVISSLDDLGAIPTVNSSREQLLLSIDVLRNSLPQAFELFADIVLHPKIGRCVCVCVCVCIEMDKHTHIYRYKTYIQTDIHTHAHTHKHRPHRSRRVQDDPGPAIGSNGAGAHGQGGHSRSSLPQPGAGAASFCHGGDTARVSCTMKRRGRGREGIDEYIRTQIDIYTE